MSNCLGTFYREIQLLVKEDVTTPTKSLLTPSQSSVTDDHISGMVMAAKPSAFQPVHKHEPTVVSGNPSQESLVTDSSPTTVSGSATTAIDSLIPAVYKISPNPMAAITSSPSVTPQSPSVTASRNVSTQNPSSSLKISVTWKEYFTGAFLPTILAVVFSIPWRVLFAAIQEIEPFYQLARPEGALAKDSIYLDYRASVNIIATIKAGRRRHFSVMWAGLCSMIVLVLAPLASGTVFIGFVGKGRCTATSSRSVCHPQLSFDPVLARTVQVILVLLALLTIFLMITVSKRRSGVFANPLCIVGIATLFQNRSLLDELRESDPDKSRSESLKKYQKGSRYRLGHFRQADGTTDYGIMRFTAPYFHDENLDRDLPSTNLTNSEEAYRLHKPRTIYLLHPLTIIIFSILVASLLALIIYYNRTAGNTGFERFMDSQSFGVTFLFTAIGVALKVYWRVLDDNLRAIHPYHVLLGASSSSSCTSKETISASPPNNPFTGLVYSFRKKAWLSTCLSCVAILTNLLIIALASIPFHAGTAYVAYRASTYIAIGILSLMLVVLAAILWRLGAGGETMRRGLEAGRDRTIGRTMSLLCGSYMLAEFSGLAKMGDKERDRLVASWGKRYGMGEVIGMDGVQRWGIDEEEFIIEETLKG
ncbi:MAG: hypothetical protein Q9190_001675 [Brigantiaea leucoxantha]